MHNQQYSIKETCVFLHELFTNLREAGFAYEEALYLVSSVMNPASGNDGRK